MYTRNVSDMDPFFPASIAKEENVKYLAVVDYSFAGYTFLIVGMTDSGMVVIPAYAGMYGGDFVTSWSKALGWQDHPELFFRLLEENLLPCE